MKKYAAYIRVSTIRQGEKGTSLLEQKSAIEGYAKREGLSIDAWFEEKETAAKIGRTVFMSMLKQIQRGGFDGLVLHKIDRGARNLKDWAELSQLSDTGVDVRVAGDSVDLTSRGGRLSADIQAVVAADYIRNLREEVRKGQRGRLKQGLYPWKPPIGYLSAGSGNPATICPVTGPLVREAFETYANGYLSIKELRHHMAKQGLHTDSRKPFGINRMHVLLCRSFYYGLINVKGEAYIGAHEPLISKQLFDTAQDVMRGRLKRTTFIRKQYAFQKLLRCTLCNVVLYAETQKGHIYYRCHSEKCRGVCIRESTVTEALRNEIQMLGLSDAATTQFSIMFNATLASAVDGVSERQKILLLQSEKGKDSIERLTDAYLDQVIDRATFGERKQRLLEEQLKLQSELAEIASSAAYIEFKGREFLELLKTLENIRKVGFSADHRRYVQKTISNFGVTGKCVEITWKNSLSLMKDRGILLACGAARDRYRTLEGSDTQECMHARLDVMKEIVNEVLFPTDEDKSGLSHSVQ
nr:recombinase family protein [uncultured Roseateles sp.]